MEIIVDPSGILSWPDHQVRCALGTGGVLVEKQEGDRGTPVGVWPLRRVLYRADRVSRPKTRLSTTPIEPDDGWCDDPHHPAYNRMIKRPHPARHEALWCEDGVYDIIVVIGYNDERITAGRGSAIFMHVAKPDYAGTAGCVALSRPDLEALLADCGPDTRIRVLAADQSAAAGG